MILHIENFAKISQADIKLEGLTVVGGDNNTGKSTLGKVLFSFFRSLSNIDSRIFKERVSSISDMVGNVLPFRIPSLETDAIELLNGKITVDMLIDNLLRKNAGTGTNMTGPYYQTLKSVLESMKEELKRKALQARTLPDSDITATIVNRVFNCVFHNQYKPLRDKRPSAKLSIDIHGKKNSMTFSSRQAKLVLQMKLFAKAWFIANPDILNLINIHDLSDAKIYAPVFDKYTYELALALSDEQEGRSAVDEAHVQRKLTPVEEQLDKVVSGYSFRNQNGDYVFHEKGNEYPTKIENLSMGMKSFVLLKIMLEKGILSEKDVLILDEPENHLHPSWQVAYALTIVMLQKTFDLTLLVTSHSLYFINALQRFAISEGILSKTHFYISCQDSQSPGFYTFHENGGKAGEIIRSFNRAFDDISNLSAEFAES